jgi:hypothetical protein
VPPPRNRQREALRAELAQRDVIQAVYRLNDESRRPGPFPSLWGSCHRHGARDAVRRAVVRSGGHVDLLPAERTTSIGLW